MAHASGVDGSRVRRCKTARLKLIYLYYSTLLILGILCVRELSLLLTSPALSTFALSRRASLIGRKTFELEWWNGSKLTTV